MKNSFVLLTVGALAGVLATSQSRDVRASLAQEPGSVSEGASALDTQTVAELLDLDGPFTASEEWRDFPNPPTVTDKGVWRIKWAGDALGGRLLWGEEPEGDFSNVEIKIRVTWITSSTNYRCGQMLYIRGDEIKEVTHRSLEMKRCG